MLVVNGLQAPGLVEYQEFEYIRHGTQTLIANFDVVTGKVINQTCGDTRTETDFDSEYSHNG